MNGPVDPIDRLAAFNQQAKAHGLMAGRDEHATRNAEVHEERLPVDPPAANATRDPTKPIGQAGQVPLGPLPSPQRES